MPLSQFDDDTGSSARLIPNKHADWAWLTLTGDTCVDADQKPLTVAPGQVAYEGFIRFRVTPEIAGDLVRALTPIMQNSRGA